MAPLSLNGTRRRWMVSLTSRPFYPQGKSRPLTIVLGVV